MTKTDKLADTPLVVSLDVLEKIIDHCVDVYNIEIEKVPERHKSGYRAGWLGYRVLGELYNAGFVAAGSRSDQVTIDEVVEALEDDETDDNMGFNES